MVKRSRLDICFDVLNVIKMGTDKPTRIMYGTNLSWITLHEIFDTLINGRFIRVERRGKGNRYYITETGSNALMYHRKSLEGLVVDRLRSRR